MENKSNILKLQLKHQIVFTSTRGKEEMHTLYHVHVLSSIWAELHLCQGCQSLNFAHGHPTYGSRQTYWICKASSQHSESLGWVTAKKSMDMLQLHFPYGRAYSMSTNKLWWWRCLDVLLITSNPQMVYRLIPESVVLGGEQHLSTLGQWPPGQYTRFELEPSELNRLRCHHLELNTFYLN